MSDPDISPTLITRDTLTHTILIEQAAKWLAREGCSIVITDMAHQGSETPDAIGWLGRARSIVIECKASLSDFRADGKKHFRREPERGMGCLRYFCTMRGLLALDDLPPRWGLLEWDGRKMRERREADHHLQNGAREEISLLMSAIRRIGRHAPSGVAVRFYTIEGRDRATLGVLTDEEVSNSPASQ